MSEGLSHPFKEGRQRELILAEIDRHERLASKALRHLESRSRRGPCVALWDDAQPTVKYLT